MIKSNKRIEIVRSTGYGLSSMSQYLCDAIFRVLNKHYAHVGVTIVNNYSDFELIAKKEPDLVFLGMKFVLKNPGFDLRDSEKLWISDYLDQLGIAYTGSARKAQEYGVDKSLAKQRILDSGFETAKFYVSSRSSTQAGALLDFPLFVKPAGRGGGAGIDNDSVVYNSRQLEAKVRSVNANFQSDALVEAYLSGREFSVAVLKDEHSPGFRIMPIELTAQPNEQGERILSGQVKSANTEQAWEIVDMAVKSKVSKLAMDCFTALGARDYGRIDIRMDEAGIPHFLEANLLPNLGEGYGSFPKACVINLGLDYEDMILSITRLGLKRNQLIDDSKAEPIADLAVLPVLPILAPA